jgi:microcystin-dependent protein
MSISAQIIVKGLDFEALTGVTGASHNQSIDEATPGANIGYVIETTDVAGVPEVPNPAETYAGHTAAWLSKCVWKRITATEVILYRWNDIAALHATYLKWEDLDTVADAALVLATSADANATLALNGANSAVGVAAAAQTSANTALTAANAATVTANNAAAQLATFGSMPRGFIAACAYNAVFSTSADQGWLKCDGTAVSRTIFASLFALVGTAWGVGDSTTTFNLPDLQGKVVGGVSSGHVIGTAGLTGAETHVLLEAELPSHKHLLANVDEPDMGGSTAAGLGAAEHLTVRSIDASNQSYALQGTATLPTLGLTGITGADAAHNNMQPTAFMHYYIKT